MACLQFQRQARLNAHCQRAQHPTPHKGTLSPMSSQRHPEQLHHTEIDRNHVSSPKMNRLAVTSSCRLHRHLLHHTFLLIPMNGHVHSALSTIHWTSYSVVCAG